VQERNTGIPATAPIGFAETETASAPGRGTPGTLRFAQGDIDSLAF